MATALLASQGPFGPTWSCLLIPVFMAGPFFAVVVLAWFLLRAEQMPYWLFGLVAAVVGWLVYLLWPLTVLPDTRGFLLVWWLASVLSMLLLPVAVFRECVKRNWFRKAGRRKRR